MLDSITNAHLLMEELDKAFHAGELKIKKESQAENNYALVLGNLKAYVFTAPFRQVSASRDGVGIDLPRRVQFDTNELNETLCNKIVDLVNKVRTQNMQ